MIIEKYSKEIFEMIEIIKSLKSLKFSSINIYGSAINEKVFVEGISDIDVIVMCQDFDSIDLNAVAIEIESLNLDFKEKRPTIIKDNLCKRIEFYLKFSRIAIDITICPGLIPTQQALEKDAWYDDFEALMGGVYANSKCIYGKIPDYDEFLNEYYPFYSNELRKKRLDSLIERLISTNERIKRYIDNGNPDLVEHLFKIRKKFIKFLYIYNYTYYWTPEKHIYYQLNQFLDLSEQEKRALCFLDGNIFEAAQKYLEVSNNYIEKYIAEEKDNKQMIKKFK